jgi:hypothetical protein
VIGDKVWFGPRHLGWGWGPVSWQGWAVLVGAGAVSTFLRRKGHRRPAGLMGLAVLGVCYLKGTEPGGRRKYAEYRAQVRAASG